MSDELDVQRGEEAERLLQNPLLVEAFDLIEREYVEQWKNSPARDEAGREKLWLSIKLLQRVHGHLTQAVETGTLAKATLLEQARRLAQQAGEKLKTF